MTVDLLILIIAFFIIAVIYSSVGFGGGSSYLALLAVMGLPFDVIRPTALLCNIIVVSGGTYIFWKSGALDLKKSWPFLFASIPLAFAGGMWRLQDDTFFFILLGICLMLAAVLLWIQPLAPLKKSFDDIYGNMLLGGGIGFLSGMVGIGGGIFLAPLLNLLNWGEPKKIAALASVFILVNSVSGLAGQITKDPQLDWSFILPLLLSVFAGGQIGARAGAKWFEPLIIKRVTALLIFVASWKILLDHW